MIFRRSQIVSTEVRLVDPGTAAQLLGLSKYTIREWCRTGRLRAERLGPEGKGGDWRIVLGGDGLPVRL